MRNLKSILVAFSLCLCIILVWCWDNSSWKNQSLIEFSWYNLTYNWNIKLEKANIKSDDPSEILDLYKEVWDAEYIDSLLIAEKYSRWMWVLAFSQDNLDTIENQWITIKNIKKIAVSTEKNKEMIIVEYEITEWFIPEVPVLYVSQFFIPENENIILMSFISDNINSRNSATSMFKNIK